MIKDIRLIIFDLDDTLLNSEKVVSEENITAIKKCNIDDIPEHNF